MRGAVGGEAEAVTAAARSGRPRSAPAFRPARNSATGSWASNEPRRRPSASSAAPPSGPHAWRGSGGAPAPPTLRRCDQETKPRRPGRARPRCRRRRIPAPGTSADPAEQVVEEHVVEHAGGCRRRAWRRGERAAGGARDDVDAAERDTGPGDERAAVRAKRGAGPHRDRVVRGRDGASARRTRRPAPARPPAATCRPRTRRARGRPPSTASDGLGAAVELRRARRPGANGAPAEARRDLHVDRVASPAPGALPQHDGVAVGGDAGRVRGRGRRGYGPSSTSGAPKRSAGRRRTAVTRVAIARRALGPGHDRVAAVGHRRGDVPSRPSVAGAELRGLAPRAAGVAHVRRRGRCRVPSNTRRRPRRSRWWPRPGRPARRRRTRATGLSVTPAAARLEEAHAVDARARTARPGAPVAAVQSERAEATVERRGLAERRGRRGGGQRAAPRRAARAGGGSTGPKAWRTSRRTTVALRCPRTRQRAVAGGAQLAGDAQAVEQRDVAQVERAAAARARSRRAGRAARSASAGARRRRGRRRGRGGRRRRSARPPWPGRRWKAAGK